MNSLSGHSRQESGDASDRSGRYLKQGSLIATAFVGVLCMLFAVRGISLPKGAGLFPKLVGGLGAVVAAICLYWQFVGSNGSEEEREKFDRTTFWTIGMTFVYSVLVFLFGYIVGTISFVFAILGAFRRQLKVLLFFAGIIVALWAVFSKVLHLRLPSGIVWQIFS